MKKAFCILFPALLIAALFCGCGKKPAFAPPEGQGWLEAWLKEEQALSESITFKDLAERNDWIAEAEILEISPLQEKAITLPNGETWTETYREYTLEIRASFPKPEMGRLRLRGASSYTDSKGDRLTAPWKQTELDGLALQTGQILWLYGQEKALDTAPFSGLPEDGLILAVDERNRLLPCREMFYENGEQRP